MDRWVGKVAVVTGASAGIGAAIVVDLVKAGLKVVGLARRKERVEELRSQIPSELVGNLYAYHCDVSNDTSVVDAFKWIESEFGAIHVLVNNAGIMKFGAISDEGNDDVFKSVLQTNLWGLVLCTKKSVEIMKRQKVTGAHIININSIAGHRVNSNLDQKPILNVYAPSKFGVTAFNEVLRQEFNYDDLKFKVTSISPGAVKSDIAGDPNLFDKLAHLQPEDISQALIYALGTPANVNVAEIIIKAVGEKI